jgi:hypothetical protein
MVPISKVKIVERESRKASFPVPHLMSVKSNLFRAFHIYKLKAITFQCLKHKPKIRMDKKGRCPSPLSSKIKNVGGIMMSCRLTEFPILLFS